MDGEPMIFLNQAWRIVQVNQPFINFPGRAGAVRGLCRSGRGGLFWESKLNKKRRRNAMLDGGFIF